jgi:hypothetical protein
VPWYSLLDIASCCAQIGHLNHNVAWPKPVCYDASTTFPGSHFYLVWLGILKKHDRALSRSCDRLADRGYGGSYAARGRFMPTATMPAPATEAAHQLHTCLYSSPDTQTAQLHRCLRTHTTALRRHLVDFRRSKHGRDPLASTERILAFDLHGSRCPSTFCC